LAGISKIPCLFLFGFRNYSYLCNRNDIVSLKFMLKNDMNELSVITTKDVEGKLITLRNQKVLLDCDVADLYGVKTKEINQAVKNNPDKFPYGYIFVLDKYEKAEVVKTFDRLNKLKFSTVEPTAFTQRGLYMLATIIKSPRATKTTLAIVDFVLFVNWQIQWKGFKMCRMAESSNNSF